MTPKTPHLDRLDREITKRHNGRIADIFLTMRVLSCMSAMMYNNLSEKTLRSFFRHERKARFNQVRGGIDLIKGQWSAVMESNEKVNNYSQVSEDFIYSVLQQIRHIPNEVQAEFLNDFTRLCEAYNKALIDGFESKNSE